MSNGRPTSPTMVRKESLSPAPPVETLEQSTPTPTPSPAPSTPRSEESVTATSAVQSTVNAANSAIDSNTNSDSTPDTSNNEPNSNNKDSPVRQKQEVLQALQDIVCEQIEWTHQGIGFTVSGENSFSARLYSIEGPQHETALVIRVTSDTFSGSSRGLRLILDNINAFVLWEYKNALSDVFIPCSCIDCVKARINPKYIPLPVFKNAATFTFEECERAIGSGFSTLPCSVYGNEVPLDSLVPDLVMSDLEAFHADYEDIYKEKELARSSNGIVYRGQYRGETVAIKEISVKLANGVVDASASEYFADFRHEVWVSSLLKHQNVVGLKAFAIKSTVDANTGERIALLAIIMEFIPHGDLYDWLHEPTAVLDWDMRLRILEEIAEGMHFLHTLSPPILHHDLKSANIFVVDKSPEAPVICRVGDFGEARTIFSYNSRERVDNPLWLAPEVMQKGRYETFADVYAYGIIMWEMCSRAFPFDEFPEAKSDFRTALEDAIVGGLRPNVDDKIEPELPLSASSNMCIPLYAELAKECWQTDRYKRPTFARVISTLQDIRAQMALNESKVIKDAEVSAAAVTDSNGAVLDSSTNSLHHHHHTSGPEELSKTEKEWVSIVESAERASDDAVSIAAIHSATHSSRTSPRGGSVGGGGGGGMMSPMSVLSPRDESVLADSVATANAAALSSSELTDVGLVASPSAPTIQIDNNAHTPADSSLQEADAGALSTESSNATAAPPAGSPRLTAAAETEPSLNANNKRHSSELAPPPATATATQRLSAEFANAATAAPPSPSTTSSSSQLGVPNTSSPSVSPITQQNGTSTKACSGEIPSHTFRTSSSSIAGSLPKPRAVALSGDSIPRPHSMSFDGEEPTASHKSRMLFGVVALNSNRRSGERTSFEALLSSHAHASTTKPHASMSGIGLKKRLAASTMIPVNALPDANHDSESED